MTQQRLVKVYSDYLSEEARYHTNKHRCETPKMIFVEPNYTKATIAILEQSYVQRVTNEILTV